MTKIDFLRKEMIGEESRPHHWIWNDEKNLCTIFEMETPSQEKLEPVCQGILLNHAQIFGADE